MVWPNDVEAAPMGLTRWAYSEKSKHSEDEKSHVILSRNSTNNDDNMFVGTYDKILIFMMSR